MSGTSGITPKAVSILTAFTLLSPLPVLGNPVTTVVHPDTQCRLAVATESPCAGVWVSIGDADKMEREREILLAVEMGKLQLKLDQSYALCTTKLAGKEDQLTILTKHNDKIGRLADAAIFSGKGKPPAFYERPWFNIMVGALLGGVAIAVGARAAD